MKNILCFGDSNTWGFNPMKRHKYDFNNRFDYNTRWTGVVQKLLGSDYHIIEEGLGGRTTLYDDPLLPARNGKNYLYPCLESHKPLDLIIIMLGTNDLRKKLGLTALEISLGIGELIKIIRSLDCGYGEADGKQPEILIISPIVIGDNIEETAFAETFSQEARRKSLQLHSYYQEIAALYNCSYFNAADFCSPSLIDAIHLDAKEHYKLGLAIADKIKEIL